MTIFRSNSLVFALITSAILATTSTSISAQPLSSYRKVSHLRSACLGADPNLILVNHSDCLAYVVGVVDATELLVAVLSENMPFCVPTGTEVAQLMSAVAKWLRAHPDEDDTLAAHAVITALKSAYPCSGR